MIIDNKPPSMEPGTREAPPNNSYELVQWERYHFEWRRDPAAQRISHKGGIGTARTEHY